MDKFKKLPREEATDGLPADQADGLPGTDDVETHQLRGGWGETGDDQPGPDELGTRLPGTGGDFRRPSGGGELTDDVEGHSQDEEAGIPGPEQLGTRLPGTGGDFRRPSGGGELTDDSEGYRAN
jgi:hypothetical protein